MFSSKIHTAQLRLWKSPNEHFLGKIDLKSGQTCSGIVFLRLPKSRPLRTEQPWREDNLDGVGLGNRISVYLRSLSQDSYQT